MRWLKKKIARWVIADLREEQAYQPQIDMPVSLSKKSSNSLNSNHKLNFSVYKAQGGHIVEFHHYNHTTDRHNESLHIIRDDEDFAKELGNIVFMECLQR